MIALKVKDVKSFMAKLLNTDTFDSFLLEEARIQTFYTFLMDGHINRDFYTREELEDEKSVPYEYARWKDVKGICFQLIKGKKVPTLMKVILHKKPEDAVALLKQGGAKELADSLKALVLTIRYDSNGLLVTTGTCHSSFVMDKTADLLWDKELRRFLEEKRIEYEEV